MTASPRTPATTTPVTAPARPAADPPVPATMWQTLAHPGWEDHQWRDQQGRDLFAAMSSEHGYDTAAAAWKGACHYHDHVAIDHGGDGCDC